ncbi:hypothetical protein [Microbacterium sp.]|uniref:hypothetical protein n=1 Tax=Microbacterium sp. TaxID=51671 RepID=UPI002FE25312
MKKRTPIILVASAALVAALAGTASAAFAQPAPTVDSAQLVNEPKAETIAPSISDLAQTVLDSTANEAGSNLLRGAGSAEALVEQKALNRTVESGAVSEEDYEANHQIYVECLNAAGFTPEFRQSSDGFYVQLPFRNVADSEQLDLALTDCATHTTAIDMIFRLQEANPQLLTDSRAVAVGCLADGGYVASSYSAEQFEQDWLSDDFPFDATEAGPNDCLWGAGYGYFAEEG